MAADRHGGQIGRYTILRPIGSGGFATVYRAVDERLNCEVALKVLAENHSLMADVRERFIAEAQNMRRVDSYWVASIFDLGETENGQPYMVLELADRGDLETRVNNIWGLNRALQREDLLLLSETLAHSLAAIHAADLVHRDVTPGNLLVRHNGLKPGPWSGMPVLDIGERLLLSDLGYAKDMRRASGITSGGGTLGFAAPEQHGDRTIVDTRADVYGATAVLQWASQRSNYEDDLTEIVRIGMARNPDDRYGDMATWNDAVRTVLTRREAAGTRNTSGRREAARRATSGGSQRRPPSMIEEQGGAPAWAKTVLMFVTGLSIGFIAAAFLWFDSDTTTMNDNIDLLTSIAATDQTPGDPADGTTGGPEGTVPNGTVGQSIDDTTVDEGASDDEAVDDGT